MWRNSRNSSARRSVLQDWAAALPREKLHLYDSTVRGWELSYAMMSVALDDAMSLRACGKVVFAGQQVTIAAALLLRFTHLMISSFETLAGSGRHASDFPTVEPLRAEFFRSGTGQWVASWSGLIHHIVLGDRGRFFHKLRTLSTMLERLQSEFGAATEEISKGDATKPAAWLALDYLHYDFNTCLREAEVVLKSFLRVLPPEETVALAIIFDPPPRLEERLAQPHLARVSDASAQ